MRPCPQLAIRLPCPLWLQLLASRGLNVFAMYDEAGGQEDTGLGTKDFGWGSPTFHKMGRQKVRAAHSVGPAGLEYIQAARHA